MSKIIKKEKCGNTSKSNLKTSDLTYLIDDRVELLHQAFKLLKPKEIEAIAPDCMRHASLDKLQELCLEELLGISSKRLCAVLDGVEPPSDTDSSSDESDRSKVAVSLESISSDEVALNTGTSSEKAKKKCKKNDGKHKKKHKSKKKSVDKDVNKTSKENKPKSEDKAGLTVLELLELQARARAIRAQLQAEQNRNKTNNATETTNLTSNKETASGDDDDDDVLIKEEPTEVVELISSDDEKPDVNKLNQEINDKALISTVDDSSTKKTDEDSPSQTVTKRNNLTIIVPKPPKTTKIKLRRNNVLTKASEPAPIDVQFEENISENTIVTAIEKPENMNKEAFDLQTSVVSTTTSTTNREKKKKSKTKKKKKDTEGSDNDEITLQLSDSEKMDLLEDFERKETTSSDESSEQSGDSETESSEPNEQTRLDKNVDKHEEKAPVDQSNDGDKEVVNTNLNNVEDCESSDLAESNSKKLKQSVDTSLKLKSNLIADNEGGNDCKNDYSISERETAGLSATEDITSTRHKEHKKKKKNKKDKKS